MDRKAGRRDALQVTTQAAFWQRYQRGKTLGQGSFGTVYECVSKANSTIHAIKIVRAPDDPDEAREMQDAVAREASCWLLSHHENGSPPPPLSSLPKSPIQWGRGGSGKPLWGVQAGARLGL